MAIEPVKIPQNVYVEDRIVGPVTLRQLMIVGVGAGFSYITWSMFIKYSGSSSIPLTVLFWTPTAIAAAFAFLKINDISLFKMILLMIEQMNKSPTRHWESGSGISINIVTRPPKQPIEEKGVKELGQSNRLAQLSQQLENEQRELAQNAKDEPHEMTQEEDDEHEQDKLLMPKPVSTDRIQVDSLHTNNSLDGIGQLKKIFPFS